MPLQADLLGAEEQVVQSLSTALSQNESDLAGPVNTMLLALQQMGKFEESSVAKIQTKIKSAATKSQKIAGNSLEVVFGNFLRMINQAIEIAEGALRELAVKGGKIQVGEPLENAVSVETPQESPMQWGGSLLLDVSSLQPSLDKLIEVLMEIRDRLPGTPVEFPGELPSKEQPSEAKEPVQLPSAQDDDYLASVPMESLYNGEPTIIS